jgi:hypothetical protein
MAALNMRMIEIFTESPKPLSFAGTVPILLSWILPQTLASFVPSFPGKMDERSESDEDSMIVEPIIGGGVSLPAEFPENLERAFANAFYLCLALASSETRSPTLRLFIALLDSRSSLTPDHWSWLGRVLNRSPDYLRTLRTKVERDEVEEYLHGHPPTRERNHDATGLEKFLLENSKLAADKGHRVTEARTAPDIHMAFMDWEKKHGLEEKDVANRYLVKIRRKLHIWASPHSTVDKFSCGNCRHGQLESLKTTLNGMDPFSLEYEELKAKIESIEIHREIVHAQFRYYHKRLVDLKEGEGVAIGDFSSQVSDKPEKTDPSDLGTRVLLFVLVLITKDNGHLCYNYYLYGVDEKSKGKWPFAQCAIEHFLLNCKLIRLDWFFDTYSGDFRNANNMLFFSIAKKHYGTSHFSV